MDLRDDVFGVWECEKIAKTLDLLGPGNLSAHLTYSCTYLSRDMKPGLLGFLAPIFLLPFTECASSPGRAKRAQYTNSNNIRPIAPSQIHCCNTIRMVFRNKREPSSVTYHYTVSAIL